MPTSRTSTADTGRCQSLGCRQINYKALPREQNIHFIAVCIIYKTWKSFRKKNMLI
jgi:hypothetical protein